MDGVLALVLVLVEKLAGRGGTTAQVDKNDEH